MLNLKPTTKEEKTPAAEKKRKKPWNQWNVLCQQPFKLKALFICQQKNYISLT